MSLVEFLKLNRTESLSFVESSCLNTIVVNTDSLVRVTDCDVEGQIVAEVVGGTVCEIELGEFSVCDVEFDLVRTENEPDD